MITKENINFSACIDVCELFEFIEQNSEYDWNTICDMEYKYRKSQDFDNERAYPIIMLRVHNTNEFHKWCEAFYDAYKYKFNNKTLYILHD